MSDDPFWQDRWHWCALAAGFLAAVEGRIGDSLYVRELAYRWYEEGAFCDRVTPREPPQCAPSPTRKLLRLRQAHNMLHSNDCPANRAERSTDA